MGLLNGEEKTRMIFIGSPALTDGFRLVGFETLTDPDVQKVDALISELLATRQNAFLVVEQTPNQVDSPLLQQVRKEGGRIVLAEVPTLQDPSCIYCDLDRQIDKLMGNSPLTGSTP